MRANFVKLDPKNGNGVRDVPMDETQVLSATSQEAVSWMKENAGRCWKEGGQIYAYIGKSVSGKIICEFCGYPKESKYISCSACGDKGW